MTLIGIAKAAAAAPVLEAKRQVSYSHLATGKWINRVEDSRHSFEWSINPYRGCEMACQYCYARYTHEFMELRQPEDFETRIFAKVWDRGAFRAELQRIPKGEAIAMGTATDPYQHAERRYELTRRILEVFAKENGRKLWITTKSDLPLRDLALLKEVSRRNVLYVNLTVTTLDADLARGLEPRAPRPDLRLGTIAALRRAGIYCGVIASPVIPGLNDSEAALDELAAAARRVDAQWFGGGVLFLKSPTREVFFDYLRREHPRLLGRFAATFYGAARPSREYHSRMEGLFESLRQRHGLSRRAAAYTPPEWDYGSQMALAL
jgi:DNA repair photolyase